MSSWKQHETLYGVCICDITKPVSLCVQVILGGGRGRLMPTYKRDPEHTSLRGLRQDGRDLIKEWISSKHAAGKSARYVWNDHEFSRIQPSSVDSLMGESSFRQPHLMLLIVTVRASWRDTTHRCTYGYFTQPLQFAWLYEWSSHTPHTQSHLCSQLVEGVRPHLHFP